MYQFLLYMWIMNRVNEDNLQNAVVKGYVSEDEKNQIMNTPQI